MSGLHLIPEDLRGRFEWHEWRNAVAVLAGAHPDEWSDIIQVLREFTLQKSHIVVGGGSKSLIAAALDLPLTQRGWREKAFSTRIAVDDKVFDSPTHSVDCFRNSVAVEVEWNNKDTFYDRDLNNFRLLFDLRAIEVGVIMTRRDELQPLFKQLLGSAAANSKFGATTTHMSKLLPRLEGGGGGGCPVLVVGIGLATYDASS
jgi:Restriction endonuclease BglII